MNRKKTKQRKCKQRGLYVDNAAKKTAITQSVVFRDETIAENARLCVQEPRALSPDSGAGEYSIQLARRAKEIFLRLLNFW
jgi:hypothetical protein